MTRLLAPTLVLTLLTSTVALSGCASADEPTTSTPTQEESPTPTSPGAADTPAEIPTEGSGSPSQVTSQEAVAVALEAVPGGTVVEVSSGVDRGRATWEVLIRKPDGSGVEVYIDQANGTVLKRESVPAGDF